VLAVDVIHQQCAGIVDISGRSYFVLPKVLKVCDQIDPPAHHFGVGDLACRARGGSRRDLISTMIEPLE